MKKVLVQHVLCLILVIVFFVVMAGSALKRLLAEYKRMFSSKHLTCQPFSLMSQVILSLRPDLSLDEGHFFVGECHFFPLLTISSVFLFKLTIVCPLAEQYLPKFLIFIVNLQNNNNYSGKRHSIFIFR